MSFPGYRELTTIPGLQVVRDYDPVEYGEFLASRKVVVETQLLELKELKEAKLLRK